MKCNLCPRRCNVDLTQNKGFCGKDSNNLKIAKVMRHNWEEPIISGEKGSGAIFFAYCSLKCGYCQNYQISHLGQGRECCCSDLIEYIKKLEQSDVENINFVTPTHYTDKILEALGKHKPRVPVVWNTSGYETEENIESLKDFVDIFLFDFKYCNSEKALEYSKAKDYFEVCLKALKKAREIIPNDIIENGKMKKGIIVRHLVLPEMWQDSCEIFDNINKTVGNDVYISVMSQYVPFYKAKEIKSLNKKVKPIEYKKVVNHISSLGFNKGFIQDFSSSNCEYTPNFDDNNFFEI